VLASKNVPQSRTSRKPEILIALSRGSRPSLQVQIQQSLRTAIREGRLQPGSQVPSTRTLAADLGVSRGVVVEAYEQLVAEGYLIASGRSLTRVAAGMSRRRAAPPVEPPHEAIEVDFRPGEPDVRSFPHQAWGRAARRAMQTLTPNHLGYGQAQGAPELRRALVDYLARARGVVGSPHQLIICTGTAQGLGIAARALGERGVRRLAVEDPGHPDIRRIVTDAGLRPVPIPVDADGMKVHLVDRARVQAVLVSPAHQNPIGAVLSPERRQQLLAWTSRASGYVIEDDYDAEYRYDRAAVGALQGVAPERVIYVGSASKILAPALRLGWLLMPEPLLRSGIELKRRADNGSPVLEQLTYASFVAAGDLDRHLRRLRRVYRARREALLDALSTHCPDWTVLGAAAGLHLVAVPPPDVDIPHMIRRAAARSIRLYPLSNYASTGSARGLIFGYARLPERDIAEAVRRMVVPELERRSCVSE